MNVSDMFQADLMEFELDSKSERELFKEIGRRLENLGYVSDAYVKGLIEREEKFPTGLVTKYLTIALPHGDAENVFKPFVFIVRLVNEIQVKQMGDGQEILTKDFLFLGIADAKKQVGLLAALMELFMNEDFVKAYTKSNKGTEIKELLDIYLKEGEEKNG